MRAQFPTTGRHGLAQRTADHVEGVDTRPALLGTVDLGESLERKLELNEITHPAQRRDRPPGWAGKLTS
jgi:hypothetical protein